MCSSGLHLSQCLEAFQSCKVRRFSPSPPTATRDRRAGPSTVERRISTPAQGLDCPRTRRACVYGPSLCDLHWGHIQGGCIHPVNSFLERTTRICISPMEDSYDVMPTRNRTRFCLRNAKHRSGAYLPVPADHSTPFGDQGRIVSRNAYEPPVPTLH